MNVFLFRNGHESFHDKLTKIHNYSRHDRHDIRHLITSNIFKTNIIIFTFTFWEPIELGDLEWKPHSVTFSKVYPSRGKEDIPKNSISQTAITSLNCCLSGYFSVSMTEWINDAICAKNNSLHYCHFEVFFYKFAMQFGFKWIIVIWDIEMSFYSFLCYYHWQDAIKKERIHRRCSHRWK